MSAPFELAVRDHIAHLLERGTLRKPLKASDFQGLILVAGVKSELATFYCA
jgi:hypothetical protein